jgi:Glyoxalase-like domain
MPGAQPRFTPCVAEVLSSETYDSLRETGVPRTDRRVAGVATSLAAVVVEAADAEAQARFWAGALQWDRVEERVGVRPAEADGIGLHFVESRRPKVGKNRMHLDLAGGTDQAGRVRRVLELGASHLDIGQGQVPWVVLADPEGNEFCVLAEGSGEGTLAAICLDADDPARQGDFWCQVSGWSVVDQGEWGVRLRPSHGKGPVLVMGPPVAPKSARNRIRFEVTADGDISEEVVRLLDAGASRVDEETLADPEGNEFRIAKAQT